MSDLPILYSFRRCPYAMRARLAVSASQTRCELREVVLRDKPQTMLDASPKGTVPVLILASGDVIEESLDIIYWALKQNDPENWLAPRSGTPEEMSELIAQCDGPFKRALDRYKYPDRYTAEGIDRTSQRQTGEVFLQTLQDRLTHHANLFGDQVALADMAIMPFVRQFANTDRDWFDQAPYPKLQAWLSHHLESSRFTSIMCKYMQWAPGDAPMLFPEDIASAG